MTYEQLRTMQATEPFRTFAIHLADGRSVTVYHQKFMMFSPKRREIIVYQPDESFNIIDLKLITHIEVRPKASSKK